MRRLDADQLRKDSPSPPANRRWNTTAVRSCTPRLPTRSSGFPSGGTYSLPSGYQTAIESYLQNVAADSGKPSNVYSVSAQYADGTGRASYSDSYGGSMTDTTAFPSGVGTCAPYTGFHGESYSACITDAKLEAEVEADVSAKGWPTGLGAEYYVVLPPHAGSCFDLAGKECFDKVFCAYHSYTGGALEIYANISYSPADVSGCGVGGVPQRPCQRQRRRHAQQPQSRGERVDHRPDAGSLVRRRRIRERRRVPELQRRLRPGAGRRCGRPLQPVDQRRPLLPPAGVEQRHRRLRAAGRSGGPGNRQPRFVHAR